MIKPGVGGRHVEEINDVALKQYSGPDDVFLGKLKPPELDPLSGKGLECRIVSIAFLPEEVERAEKLFAKMLEQATGGCLGQPLRRLRPLPRRPHRRQGCRGREEHGNGVRAAVGFGGEAPVSCRWRRGLSDAIILAPERTGQSRF